MKRYFSRLLLLMVAGWLIGQNGLHAQFLPQSYAIPQASVVNNGSGTQTVTYTWSPLAGNITTVFLMYMPVGGSSWTVASAGGSTSPQTATMPVGSYQYAIGLNSTSNVVLMNGTLPAPDYNYIRAWTATAPDQSASDIITRPLTDVKQTTDYFDGLGRSLQTVEKQKSPAGNDEVTAKYYDAMGRVQTYQFLPFTSNSLANSADVPNDGNFKSDPFQQQAAFFNNGSSTNPINGQGETYFYGQSVYETSPLDRVINSYEPGNNWVGSQGSGSPRSTQTKYLTNNPTDNVYIFNVAWTPSQPPATSSLQVGVVNNGNNTQTVTWSWGSLGSTAEEVLMQYAPIGSSTWTTANATGGNYTSGTATIPVGNYQYAIEVYYSSGNPVIINAVMPVGNPGLAVSLVNNGNGTQTVTYNWTTLTNVGTVLLLYSPVGTTPNWQNPSTGGTNSPVSITIPAGNYMYAIELMYTNGSPNQIVEAPMTTTATYSSTSSYAAGTLIKTITTDENNNQVVTFTDFEGRVILKKVQAAASVADGYTGWLCTFYVYDDYGMLRLVMPPLATNAYLAGQTIASFQDALCYRYEYDQRHRLIVKKAPGVGEQWTVYDARDRVALSQDANLRAGNATGTANQWVYKKYDGLNRPVMTGLYTDNAATSQAAEQANLNLLNMGLYETYTPGSFPQYSLTNSYPSVASGSVMSVNYYDDYTWVAGSGSGLSATLNTTGSSNFKPASTTSSPYYVTPAQSPQTKGLTTGTSANVLGTSTFLYNVSFYDAKSRLIQNQSNNITTGIDIASTQYDWEGKSLITVLQHQMNSTNPQSYTVVSTMNYDAMDRLTSTTKNITNGTLSDQQTIQTSTYDELNHLRTKTFETDLDELTYDYNIRGWLLGINRAYLGTVTNPNNIAPSAGNWFGLELAYDKTTSSAVDNTYAAAQYNGNVAGTVWKTAGNGVGRKYDFTYDNANRLFGANYTQDNGNGGYDVSAGLNFSVPTLGYDANGNITKMYEMGWQIGSGSSTIDQLVYTYPPNSNQLQNVIDPPSNASTTLGDFRYSAAYTKALNGPKPTTAVDYTYDPDGNLISDKNKDITAISYNYLNLPKLVTIVNASGTNTVGYTYDAFGNKLVKTTNEAAGTFTDPNNAQTYTTTIQTITTYVAGFVYQTKSYNSTVNALSPAVTYTNELQYNLHDEGRVRALYKNPALPTQLTGFAFDFFEKDHLGDTRVILTDEPEIDYYPPTTLEGSTSSTSSPVSYESSYYSINPTYIVLNTYATGLSPYANNASTYNYTTNSNLYPSSNSAGNTDATSNSGNVYRINGSLNKMGLGITLKVMAGDKLSIGGQSYYFSQNSNDNSSYNLPVLTMLTGFLGAPGVSSITTSGDAGVTASGLDGLSNLATNVANYLTNSAGGVTRTPTTSLTPRAYINWVFFDEQFNYAGGGFYPVSGAGVIQSYTATPASTILGSIIVPKSGFVYVYCSNESPVDVFFDNIQVVDTRGNLLEENHYYPFGLAMAGISDEAVKTNYAENKYRFNMGTELQNKEFSDGSGLQLYDTKHRMYDPQLGRFGQIDPLGDVANYFSPYSFGSDNPMNHNDALGLVDSVVTTRTTNLRPAYVYGHKQEPFNWLGYPSSTKSERRRWARNQDMYYDRLHSNQPLSQQGDPDSYMASLGMYKRWTQAEKDSRAMQAWAVGIMAAPALLAVSPVEVGLAMQMEAGWHGGAWAVDAGIQTMTNVMEGKNPLTNYNVLAGGLALGTGVPEEATISNIIGANLITATVGTSVNVSIDAVKRRDVLSFNLSSILIGTAFGSAAGAGSMKLGKGGNLMDMMFSPLNFTGAAIDEVTKPKENK